MLTISKSSINSSSDSYQTSITVTCNTNWSVSGGDGWCQFSPAQGSGNGKFDVTILQNTGTEERSTTLTVVAGSVSSEIKITQKQKDALILTRREESISSEGGTISVELKSNINYSVIIPLQDTWVSIVQTRSFTTYGYDLTIAKNSSLNTRSTKIIFKDNASSLADTLTITQGIPQAVSLNTKKCYTPKSGGTFPVTLSYNAEYDYTILDGDGWVTIAETKALTTKQYSVNISVNPSDENRFASIIFRLKTLPAGEQKFSADTLLIKQSGFDGYYIYSDGSSPLWSLIPSSHRSSITRLKVEGLLSKSDIYTIRDSIKGATHIDLGEVTLDTLPDRAFKMLSPPSVLNSIILPAKLKIVGEEAFYRCQQLDSVTLPSTVEGIGTAAFSNCQDLKKVESKISIPFELSQVFTAVNSQAHLVVPQGTVVNYQSTPGWGYDFFYRIYEKGSDPEEYLKLEGYSILSNSTGLDTTLRVDASSHWEVVKTPSWITASGSGLPGSDLELDIATFSGNGSREDSVILGITGSSLTSFIKIKQHGLPFNDGHCIALQNATTGNGVDIVFMGDGYSIEDIASEKYEDDIREAYGHFFDIEPYRSYKEYFNVYMVYVFSAESGISDVSTVVNTALGTRYTKDKPSTSMTTNTSTVFEYALKAPIKGLTTTLVIDIANSSRYGGTCILYSDNKAVAICPKSNSSYPYDFRGVVQHEAGGHGFGKLADEYVTNTGTIPQSEIDDLKFWQSKEHYKNVDVTGVVSSILWKHIASHANYSSYVSSYEGAYYYSKGVWRPEMSSVMINNIRYVNAPGREMIVKRIMSLAGLQYTFENFVAKDVKETAAATKGADYPVVPEMLLPPPILIP
jgi:hypothetical protein